MVQSTGRDRTRDPDDAWRISGAGRLSRRQLAYLRELWRWRDEHAQRANRPPFMVFGNQQIFELITWAESHPGMPLQQGPKLPRNIRDSLLTTLAAAISSGQSVLSALAERKRGERVEALSADSLEKLNALRSECAQIAKQLEIAAATLAPKAALDAIARSGPQTVDEIMESGRLLRWQAEIVQGAVKKCFSE
jgi:ribonuclease D